MTLPLTFWRRLSLVLTLALSITGWNLYIRTGYPKEWDEVRYGMHGAEVWFLCGKPTESSGMKPDQWVRPFLFGRWEFRVNCGDVQEGHPAPVTDISLYYESFLTGKTWIKKYSPFVYIVDHQAYERAFGFHYHAKAEPEKKQ
ncbi:MAG: hypothetical protein HY916_02550 [Desulfovibrio sp.]|jgi:hypothetical protein|nr:hypothetical protein [Desulfovibrio sp.]